MKCKRIYTESESAREVRLAYMRGYSRGSNGKWPNTASIPDDRYRRLLGAARDLSEKADVFMAGFDDRDTEPKMIAMDAARDRIETEVDAAVRAALEDEDPALLEREQEADKRQAAHEQRRRDHWEGP